jgi:hypothetical protein
MYISFTILVLSVLVEVIDQKCSYNSFLSVKQQIYILKELYIGIVGV